MGEPNLTPATFDEWLAGLDVRPSRQRPGQWAVNTLTPELWAAVNGTPFDAYHIGERLPDLIRYARHWWGAMEVSKDGAGIPACMWMAVNRGRLPGDADDCAPGLDYPPILGLSIAAVIDHAGRVVHEVRIDEEPVYDTLLWCEIPDAAHELEGFGHHEAATALLLWLDVDRDDRPSPGDDITRAAFGAMDGYRRSNDSGDGGTP